MYLNGFRLFVFFIFILTHPIQGQVDTIVMRGTVKDSVQTPLDFANIIAKPKDTSKKIVFTYSDEEGNFKLKLEKNVLYNISVSYLGYTTLNFDIVPTKSFTKNLVLNNSDDKLEEVIIEMPVLVKKDTIIYNADHFLTGEERKLKNLLKKLPGVEVDKKGGITVEGKKVTKMLVEGKKFFGGGTKLAVENIPADAVDKVEVLDNYNDVAFLKNFSDSDEMAMNIKLKEDKKQFVFGDIELAKGNQKFYGSNASLFFYSPKTNINFIGNINNVGEQTFTFEDYLNFQGGVNAVFNDDFDFNGGNFSQFMQNQDVLRSVQRFGALNIRKATSSKLDISGYTIFSHNNITNFSETINEYSTFLEDVKNLNHFKNISGIGQLNIEYNPNESEQWYIRTQLKKNNNYQKNNILSRVNNTTNSIDIHKSNGVWYLNQNIEWHKKQTKNHTFSTVIDYTLDINNPKNLWKSTNPILGTIIPVNQDQEILRLQQLKENKKHYLLSVFKDFWVLNGNNHIYTTIGNIYQREKFLSNDFQELDNGTINSFALDGFNNSTTFNHNDFFAGIHYKFRKGIFTLKQGLFLHYYDWSVNQETKFDHNKLVLLPNFLMKIEFNKSKKIQVNYNLKTNFSNASRLANRFYLQSYNSIFKGNSNIENELYHSARVRYNYFSLYRGLMLLAAIQYDKKINGFVNTVTFNGINRFSGINLFNNPSERWNVNATLRKRIDKIRYKLSGRYNNSSYLQQINNSFINNISENYSYRVGIKTLYDDFPTIEIGFKKTIGNYTSSNSKSRFTTDEPYLNMDYTFTKGFNFNFDYTYYNYQNKAQNAKNIYSVANMTLSYKKEESPWSYKLSSQNLFNTQFKQNNSFSDYLISDSKTFILPRVIMFSVGYDL